MLDRGGAGAWAQGTVVMILGDSALSCAGRAGKATTSGPKEKARVRREGGPMGVSRQPGSVVRVTDFSGGTSIVPRRGKSLVGDRHAALLRGW